MEESWPGAEKLAKTGEWFCRAIANNDRSRGIGLVLSGSVGCGKTKVARGIFRYVQAWAPDLIAVHKELAGDRGG